MKCNLCNGTGKYKKPNDEKEFERLVDIEMDKGYFVNLEIAQEKAYQRVGYTIVDCPYCSKEKKGN